jgi:acyl carrier protein
MQDRPAETDEEFLIHCELLLHPRALEIARGIRRAIATQADLNPETIHSEDRIPEDLGDIFCRESLNVVEFFMLVEEELNVHIPDGPVADLVSRETVTVKEIVSINSGLVSRQLSQSKEETLKE